MTVDERIKLAESMTPLRTLLLESFDENAHINELSAMSKVQFDARLDTRGYELYCHVIYLATLKTIFPENVIHWAKEIWELTGWLFVTKSTFKNIYRSVENSFVKFQMGSDFEDYCVDDFCNAYNEEIKKNSKKIKKNPKEERKLKKEINVLTELLESVDENYISKYKDEISNFYKELLRSVKEKDKNILIDAICELAETDEWT